MSGDGFVTFRKMLWLIVASVGLIFVLQAADLWALQVLLANGDNQMSQQVDGYPLPEAGVPMPTDLGTSGSSTYLPIAEQPTDETSATLGVAADAPDSVQSFALVGDGGDLGGLARAVVGRFAPLVFATRIRGEVYVDLAQMAQRFQGELRWKAGDDQAILITDDNVVRLQPDATEAEVNLSPALLVAPPVVSGERLMIPVKALGQLLDTEVEWSEERHVFTVNINRTPISLVALEDVFKLRVSRSQRRLQVYVLGEPVKSYPMCVGLGNNTPVGHFHIQNRAIWPPWRSYEGEYIPGGSSRNPLGARWLGTTARGRSRGWVIGMHGTNQPGSIGRRISGGCMRLHNADAIELFNNIPIGTRVWIHEEPIVHSHNP